MRIHTFYSGWGCAVWRRPWRTPPIGGAVQQMSVRYATVTSSQKNPPTYWSQGHQVGIHFKHSLVPQNPISHRLQTHCSSRLAGSGQRARAMTLWPMHLPWKLPLCLSLGMTGISCQDLPGRLDSSSQARWLPVYSFSHWLSGYDENAFWILETIDVDARFRQNGDSVN